MSDTPTPTPAEPHAADGDAPVPAQRPAPEPTPLPNPRTPAEARLDINVSLGVTPAPLPPRPWSPAQYAAAVADYFAAHPEQHDQRWYVRAVATDPDAVDPDGEAKLRNLVIAPGDPIEEGVTVCIAGLVAYFAGYTLHASDSTSAVTGYVSPPGNPTQLLYADDVARPLLGLTPRQGQRVFLAFDETEALWRLHRYVLGPPDESHDQWAPVTPEAHAA